MRLLSTCSFSKLLARRATAVARYHLLTGEPLAVEEAKNYGLVNEVVSGDNVLPRAQELAKRLADAPRGAIRGTKRIFSRLALTLGAGFFEFAAEVERLSLYSEAHRDVLRAMAATNSPDQHS